MSAAVARSLTPRARWVCSSTTPATASRARSSRVPLDRRPRPVRDQRVRPDPHVPARAARHARPGLGQDRQHRLDGRPDVLARRRPLSRHQVRARGPQRLTALRGPRLRRRRHSDRAGSDHHQLRRRGLGLGAVAGDAEQRAVRRLQPRGRKLTAEAYTGPMIKLGGGPEKVAEAIAGALDAKRPKARYPVTAERAPDDQPAPHHPGPGVGPDHALAVPHAPALSPVPASVRGESSAPRRNVPASRSSARPAPRPRPATSAARRLAERQTARWPPRSSAPRRHARRRCPAGCRRSRSSAPGGTSRPPSRPGGARSRAARRDPRHLTRTLPGRRGNAADPRPLELEPRDRLVVTGHQRQLASSRVSQPVQQIGDPRQHPCRPANGRQSWA